MIDEAALSLRATAPVHGPTERTSLLAPERAVLTVGLVLVVTMAAFEALAVATVLPQAENDLGGLGLYGLIFVSYMLASLAGILVAGRQADRQGLAVPFTAGLAVFAVGLLAGGFSPTMLALVGARGVQGLGAGAVVTTAYAAIARGYDESLRPRMFAVLASAWVVPGLIGPSLSGAVAEHLTWRLVFLGILPFVALGGAFTLPALRRMAPPAQRAANAAATPLLREAPALIPAVAVLGLLTMTFFGAEAYLPLTLSEVLNRGPAISGIALTAGTLAWAAGSWLQARRSAWDRRIVVSSGLVLVGGGILLLIPLAAGGPVWLAPLSWAVAGLGIGMAYPSMSLIILAAAPAGREGAASAAVNTSSVAGSAAGTGIGAAFVALGASGLWSTTTSVVLIFATMTAIVGFALAAAQRLGR